MADRFPWAVFNTTANEPISTQRQVSTELVRHLIFSILSKKDMDLSFPFPLFPFIYLPTTTTTANNGASKRSHASFTLEGIVLEGGHQVSDTSLGGGASLNNESGGGPHGKTSVVNFLGLEALKLGRVASAESEWIQAKVTWFAHAGFAAGGGGDSGDHLGDHDHDEGEGNVLWVGAPELPEGIHLVLGGGHLATWSRSEAFGLDESNDGKHGNTGVLDEIDCKYLG